MHEKTPGPVWIEFMDYNWLLVLRGPIRSLIFRCLMNHCPRPSPKEDPCPVESAPRNPRRWRRLGLAHDRLILESIGSTGWNRVRGGPSGHLRRADRSAGGGAGGPHGLRARRVLASAPARDHRLGVGRPPLQVVLRVTRLGPGRPAAGSGRPVHRHGLGKLITRRDRRFRLGGASAPRPAPARGVAAGRRRRRPSATQSSLIRPRAPHGQSSRSASTQP